MLHLCKGMDIASLRPPIVDLILRGREHWDNVNATLSGKPKRVPVTIKVMKYLKRVIRESSFGCEKKLRLWLICCLLWNGSLRVHKVLSKYKLNFDPLTTLCNKDVELIKFQNDKGERSLLRIFIKSPKEKRIGTGVKLEIFGNCTFCCPVKAWEKWRKCTEPSQSLPVFMEGDVCFTGRDFNRVLSSFTEKLTEGTDGVVKPHSFRSGVATEMGIRGFSDSDIQAQGRWSSQAFKAYMKLDRLKRLKLTERIADIIK